MKEFPIILVHHGNSSYLYDTIFQLRQSNPEVNIYLIGSRESLVYEPMIKHVIAGEYKNESELFRQRYRHFSTNPFEFELLCLERWLILKAFMQANDIDQALYIDSDVLLFSDVRELIAEIGEFGMTICGISGHTNFVKIDVLEDFCGFLMEAYKDESAISKLEQKFKVFKSENPAGGISDMTFLKEYYTLHQDRVMNIRYFGDDEAFDITIDTGIGEYEMNGFGKVVFWKGDKPYCLRIKDNKKVLHHTLHFQGGKKKQIGNYVRSKNARYYINKRYFQVVLAFQKVRKKLLGVQQ